MSTYDISGLDWQTAHNNSTAAPSCRESDGMTKVADSFYEGQIHSVDAVFCEGYLRGLNHALRMLGLEIRNRATENAMNTLGTITLPDLLDQSRDLPEHIRGVILSFISTFFYLENQNRQRGEKLKTPQSLPGYVVARVLLRTGAIRLMKFEGSGSQIIAKYYHMEHGTWKWSGTYYKFSEKDLACQIMQAFQRLSPNGTAQDVETFKRELRRAPVAYLQRDDKLVWFRNGVWDYRTRTLTAYEDPSFEAKYPDQITLGKLPVFHPYGAGAVLHPDAAGYVAEPIIHNDKDGTDWHPGQMLEDPFDMTTAEGRASSLIIWQAMQFTIRHLNGLPGLYHFWVNANGKGHNGKGAIWAMIRRLLVRDFGPGDEDLQSPNNSGLVIPLAIEELKQDFGLSQNIQTAYAIVGEETSAGSGTTYVDKCAVAKMLARSQEMQFRVIYGEAFTFTFRGLLLQQSNKAPVFAEKNDSIMGTPKGRRKRGTGYAGRCEAASSPLMPFLLFYSAAEPVQGERSSCRSSTGWKAVTACSKIG